MVARVGWGGVCGCSGACMVARGVCMVAPGGWHAWLLLGGMRGCSRGGMCGCSRGGMRGCSGGGMHAIRDTTRYGDTVNERAVRILLECILVKKSFSLLNVNLKLDSL